MRINFCWFKPPSLWWFVMAALESLTHDVISENHCYRQRQVTGQKWERRGRCECLRRQRRRLRTRHLDRDLEWSLCDVIHPCGNLGKVLQEAGAVSAEVLREELDLAGQWLELWGEWWESRAQRCLATAVCPDYTFDEVGKRRKGERWQLGSCGLFGSPGSHPGLGEGPMETLWLDPEVGPSVHAGGQTACMPAGPSPNLSPGSGCPTCLACSSEREPQKYMRQGPRCLLWTSSWVDMQPSKQGV